MFKPLIIQNKIPTSHTLEITKFIATYRGTSTQLCRYLFYLYFRHTKTYITLIQR